MKPEILLKAFVRYKSEDAFRELVAGSLDEVYSRALRIVEGPPHLVEEAVLRVYWELARKAPRLAEEDELASWLREQTCKIAVAVLREADRSVPGAVLRKEKQAVSTPDVVQAAPPGLLIRVCEGVLLNAARSKGFSHLLLPAWMSGWSRQARIGAGAVCLLVIFVAWKIPIHKSNAIVESPELILTPASYGQLAGPDEEGSAPQPSPVANANAATNANQP